MFAQAIYLLFSPVYVCKETVEHFLLSTEGREGHQHHHEDEEVGLGGTCQSFNLPFYAH